MEDENYPIFGVLFTAHNHDSGIQNIAATHPQPSDLQQQTSYTNQGQIVSVLHNETVVRTLGESSSSESNNDHLSNGVGGFDSLLQSTSTESMAMHDDQTLVRVTDTSTLQTNGADDETQRVTTAVQSLTITSQQAIQSVEEISERTNSSLVLNAIHCNASNATLQSPPTTLVSAGQSQNSSQTINSNQNNRGTQNSIQDSSQTQTFNLQTQNSNQSSSQTQNFNQNSCQAQNSMQNITQAQNSSQNSLVDIVVPIEVSIFNNPAPGTSRSPQTQVSSEDENVLKYFIILRPTGPAAKVLSRVCKDLYLGGQDNVKDYCINRLGLRNADYRKLFTGLERQMLEAGTSWDTLDITFLYKLLQRVCGLAPSAEKKWADPHPHDRNSLEHNLYLIKGERNFLAHEAVVLTNLELEQRSQRVKTLLMNVLHETGVRTNFDYSQNIATMKSTIDEILKSSTPMSLQVYQKELEELRSKIVNKVVRESQSELCTYYLDLWSSTIVSWSHIQTLGSAEDGSLPKMEQVFTNITIKDINGDDVDPSDLFQHCLCSSLPRLLIIEGIAGIGKSYICKFLLHKWASKNASEVGLHEADIVIFIQCHSVNSNSLREFLCEELLPLTCNSLRHEDVIPAFRKCNVIFIIDGIDEAGSRAKGIIKEVNTKFPASRVLITCRPEFTEVTKLLLTENKSFSIFYARGFSGLQRKEYLGKLLSTLHNNKTYHYTTETLYEKIKELENQLVSLLTLPLTVMMVVLLLLEDTGSLSLSTTATHIYQQTVDMRIKQVAERIHRRPMESRHISLIERLCDQWLKALCEVAWEALLDNTQIIDEKNTSVLMDKAVEHNIDPMDVMSSFLKCKVLGHKYVWEFFHKAFQEYLSASYLSCTTKDVLAEFNKGFCKEEKKSTNSLFSIYSEPYVHKSNCFTRILNFWQALCRCKKKMYVERHSHSYSIYPKRKGKVIHHFQNRHEEGFLQTISSNACINEMGSLQGDESLTFTADVYGRSRSKIRSSRSRSRDRRSSSRSKSRNCRSSSRSRSISSSRSRSRYHRQSSNTSNRSTDQCQSSNESQTSSRSTLRRAIVGMTPRAGQIPEEFEIYESSYEFVESITQKNAAYQNMLQFLGAMEASKPEIDIYKLKNIVERFSQSIVIHKWVKWATFVKECHEIPIVCELVQPYLNGSDIDAWLTGQTTYEHLEAVEYLLKKTQFIPAKIILCFYKDNLFPSNLKSLLSTIREMVPTVTSKLKCLFKHSKHMHNALAPLETLDLIVLTISGTLEHGQKEDFVALMKFLDDKDANVKLKFWVSRADDLTVVAHCCMSVGLPKKAQLQLAVTCISNDMMSSLCQVLDTFSWIKPFSFLFNHTDLSEDIAKIQDLLISVLQRDSVQLKDVELVVDAYAESMIDSYEAMAQTIAGDIPVALIFNDWADGDDVRLVFYGERKS